MVLAVSNFSSVFHENYKIGVPHRGIYTEVFSSDKTEFGGSGIENRKVTAKSGEMHGQKYHIALKLPPFSTTYYYKKKPKDAAPKEEKAGKTKTKQTRKTKKGTTKNAK